MEGSQGNFLNQIIVVKSDGFQKGLTSEDVLSLSTEDDARRNAERLQRFWDEEIEACKLANDGKEEADKVHPSLPKVSILCWLTFTFSSL